MAPKEYVIRGCADKVLDLIAPKRGNPGILAYDYSVRPAECVIDAQTWAEARDQLTTWWHNKAALDA